MGIEAKQIQQGAAHSREEKSSFFLFRCPHSPPSEIRLAWSKAARFSLGASIVVLGAESQVTTEDEEIKIG